MTIMLPSCDSAIYDEEGDCVVHYLVKFKYDYNMKYADAFHAEVEQVTLHLIDADGKIVWQKTESGDLLKAEDYAMEVDVTPGTYSLLAWCSSANPTTFDAHNDGTGRSLKVDFHTDIRQDGSEHIGPDKRIDRLYHGYVPDVNFPAADEGTFVHTIPLTKDTNHFVIALQQLSGEPIDKDLVEFEIIDDNAHLDWDNSPITGRPLTYHQWYKATVNADLSTEARTSADDIVNDRFAGVVAELTTSRLMEHSNAILRVYRTDTGRNIAQIRLIDALLLVMGYDNKHNLSVQKYLDYKDEYDLTFFLDENHEWLDGVIKIHSWRVVYQEHELN